MELSLTSIAAIATALGGGSIITLWLTRRFRKADQKEEMHVTVESKKIDADSDAFTHVINRLEKVEQWLKELQDKLATEMATNSRLEAENEALRKDNDRQQGEIERLRARVHDLADKIQTRDAQIESFKRSLDESSRQMETLRSELHATTKELNAMKRPV